MRGFGLDEELEEEEEEEEEEVLLPHFQGNASPPTLLISPAPPQPLPTSQAVTSANKVVDQKSETDVGTPTPPKKVALAPEETQQLKELRAPQGHERIDVLKAEPEGPCGKEVPSNTQLKPEASANATRNKTDEKKTPKTASHPGKLPLVPITQVSNASKNTRPLARGQCKDAQGNSMSENASKTPKLHPFFMKRVEKKAQKVAEKTVTETPTYKEAAETPRNIPDMFLTAKERKKRQEEKKLEQLRSLAKGSDKLASSVASGKEKHPFLQRKPEQAQAAAAIAANSITGTKRKSSQKCVQPPFHVQQLTLEECDWLDTFCGNEKHPGLIPRVEEYAGCPALYTTPQYIDSDGSWLRNLVKRCPLTFRGEDPLRDSAIESFSCGPGIDLGSLYGRLRVGSQRDQLSIESLSTLQRQLSRKWTESGLTQSSLWTNIFEPFDACEVCGNKAALQEICSWLTAWQDLSSENSSKNKGKRMHERGRGRARKETKRPSCKKRNDDDFIDDFIVYEDDEDYEGVSDSAVAPAILLHGPHGCGKTAAVYACARQFGLNVIEINGSERRSGANLLSLVGEATQSHSLSVGSSVSHAGKSSKGSFQNMFLKKQDTSCTTKLGGKNTQKVEIDHAILLFEEVDTLCEEERRSFWSSLATLMSTTKRPMVLTCNSIVQEADELKQLKKIKFCSIDASSVAGYCTLASHAAGRKVSPELILGITNANECDLRKSLLETQWLSLKLSKSQRSSSTASASDDDIMHLHFYNCWQEYVHKLPWQDEAPLPSMRDVAALADSFSSSDTLWEDRSIQDHEGLEGIKLAGQVSALLARGSTLSTLNQKMDRIPNENDSQHFLELRRYEDSLLELPHPGNKPHRSQGSRVYPEPSGPSLMKYMQQRQESMDDALRGAEDMLPMSMRFRCFFAYSDHDRPSCHSGHSEVIERIGWLCRMVKAEDHRLAGETSGRRRSRRVCHLHEMSSSQLEKLRRVAQYAGDLSVCEGWRDNEESANDVHDQSKGSTKETLLLKAEDKILSNDIHTEELALEETTKCEQQRTPMVGESEGTTCKRVCADDIGTVTTHKSMLGANASHKCPRLSDESMTSTQKLNTVPETPLDEDGKEMLASTQPKTTGPAPLPMAADESLDTIARRLSNEMMATADTTVGAEQLCQGKQEDAATQLTDGMEVDAQ